MNTLSLGSYRAVCWRAGKPGFMDVVGAFPLTEISTKTSSKNDVTSSSIALECVKQPEQNLVVWSGSSGAKDFKKNGEGLRKVLHVCKTATHSGVFFTHHKGERLGFALIAHDARDPRRLLSKPALYKDELSSLMASALPNDVDSKRTRQEGTRQLVVVRQAVLRETIQGHVLAAVLVNRRGDAYVVIAHLAKNEWRKWRVEASIGAMPCIYVSGSGCDVRLVHCDLEAPSEFTYAVAAPTLPLALSTFDRVSAANVNVTAQGTSVTPPLVCVAFRELILPTSGGGAAEERFFQSQCIERVSGDCTVAPRPCFVQVDEASAVYTVVVLYGGNRCLVHMCYSEGGVELLASCVEVPGLRQPISACTLTVLHKHRPQGANVSLLLCDDMRLHCCEHFGQPATVSLRLEEMDCPTITFPELSTGKSSKRGTSGWALPARLVPLHNKSEILCTNAAVGLFLRVTSASFSENVPAPAGGVVNNTADGTGYRIAGEAGGGAVALHQCIGLLHKLSVSTSRHNLPDIVFRDIMPLLRFVGTSQQEVMLVQRVYEQLLQMAEPNSEADWEFLWALTSVLQKALVKRGRDNQLQYTDAFFLQLAEAHRKKKLASLRGDELVEEGVRAVVSTEVQGVIAAPEVALPVEAMFLLEGLAAGVAPVVLAEEISRRMVRTETLLNGACAVACQSGVADCVHCMGTVLFASCLDLSVFVFADDARGLRVSMEQPQDGVCVAVKSHTFASQGEFETALAFAGDLLSVPSADGSFRPDIALLTLGIGGRQHCVAAFLQLFAPALRQAVDEVTPLSSNRTWFEDCVAMLSQSSTEWAASLLLQSSSNSFTLTATLCHLMRPTQRDVDAFFLGSLSRILSEEFCTTALVAVLFHQTERLLAATQNYASALAAHTLSNKSEAEQGASWQVTEVGRRRLEVTLAQTCALWAQVDLLSPYRVRDVAESYRLCVGNSLASAEIAMSASAEGTMVSRTLVLCFRIFCLVQYTLRAEEVMSLPLGSNWTGWTTDEAFVKDFHGALEDLYLLPDSPFPLEWLQNKFVSRVRRAAAVKPLWVPFLVRLLRLSNIRHSNSASLKREYYALLDTLQNCSTPSALAAEGEMHKAIAAAESAIHVITLQAELGHTPNSAEGGTAALSASTAFFIFSHQRDASLPKWTYPHTLAERRYLLPSTWADALWTLERVPGRLYTVCAAAVARVHRADSENPTKVGGGDYPPSLSEELALPLYAHLCRLRPPVRMHAVTDSGSVVSNGAGDSVQRRTRHVIKPEVSQEITATPEKLAAPPQEEVVSVAPRNAVATMMPGSLLPPVIDGAEDIRTRYRVSIPEDQANGVASTGVATPAVPARDTTARAGLYSPADVAWWDTLETAPRQQSELGVSRTCAPAIAVSPASTEDNGESSDSATTYTTSTSNYTDPLAAADSFGRPFYPKTYSRVAAEGGECSCANAKSHLCRRRSTLENPTAPNNKKRCRCCHRVMRIGRHSCSQGGRQEVADDSTPIRVQWGATAREATATHARSPPVASDLLTEGKERPRLLTFASRLQPPEDPPAFRVHPTQNLPRTLPCATTPFSLLTFPSTATGKKESRVHLYTLDGEHIRVADGQNMVSVETTSCPGADAVAGTLLSVPPLPATSVFGAPQPLLSLPPEAAAVQRDNKKTQSPRVPLPTHSGSVEELGRSYAQVQRAPAGPAPEAVDVATLEAVATCPPALAAATNENVSTATGTAVPAAPLPAPLVRESAPTLSLPVAPSLVSASALNATEKCEFRRYTDDLLARHHRTSPPHPLPAASVPSAASPTLAPPSATQAATAAVHTPGIDQLLQQQDEFIHKAEVILEKRQAENEAFYRRVMESVRGLPAASQTLRGLSPVEQAQLVQNTVKQRNELMTLNHQLLEMQLSAARHQGETPQVTSEVKVSYPTTPQPVTSTGATQTQPLQRESVGVSPVEVSGPIPSALASSAAAVPLVAKSALSNAGMRETLSDLQRLNTELMAVNRSAEAMDNAIKETREVIQRYERNKTADALTAEGIALTSAMRMRTAAVEQRLAALPQAVECTVASVSSRSPSVWVSQKSVADTIVDPLSAAAIPLSSSSRVRAEVNPSSAAVARERPLLDDVSRHVSSPNPPKSETISTSVAQIAAPSQPDQVLSPAAEVATAPVESSATPRASPTFISVTSDPLREAVEEQSVAQRTNSFPILRYDVQQIANQEWYAPSVHARADPGPTPRQRSLSPSDSTAPLLEKPRDLRCLFLEAGGRYVTPSHVSGAPMWRRAAAPPRNLQVDLSPLKGPSAKRRVPPSGSASTRPPGHVQEDRYAMYRAASRPRTAHPLATAKTGVSVSRVSPPPAPRRVSTGDKFVDRQQSRRMASITKRMHQLEQDLFT